MRKLFILGAGLAVAASLAGCASLENSGIDPKIASTFDQVEKYSVLACSFAPTIETVAAIVAKNNPALLTAEQIGAALCDAIHSAPPASPGTASLGARLSGKVATVAGVVVAGTYKPGL